MEISGSEIYILKMRNLKTGKFFKFRIQKPWKILERYRK